MVWFVDNNIIMREAKIDAEVTLHHQKQKNRNLMYEIYV